jgi:hypothetical protein
MRHPIVGDRDLELALRDIRSCVRANLSLQSVRVVKSLELLLVVVVVVVVVVGRRAGLVFGFCGTGSVQGGPSIQTWE